MNEVPISLRDIEWVEPREPRRVVDQSVEPPDPPLNLTKHASDLVNALQIRLKQLRPRTAFLRALSRVWLGPSIMDRDACALCRQPQSDRAPNPLCRTCHQYDFVLQRDLQKKRWDCPFAPPVSNTILSFNETSRRKGRTAQETHVPSRCEARPTSGSSARLPTERRKT